MFHRLIATVGLASTPKPTTPWPPAATVDSPPKPTESAIVAETVAGSHVLAVKGYCRTKGLGKGEFITSSIFRVGGCRWSIVYYPDGSGSKNTGWISVFLQLDKSPGIDAKAWCRFVLLDGAGEPVPSHGCAVRFPKPVVDLTKSGFCALIGRQNRLAIFWDSAPRPTAHAHISGGHRKEPSSLFSKKIRFSQKPKPPNPIAKRAGRLGSSTSTSRADTLSP